MRASAGEGLMKTPDFQAFVEQLGDLSEGQRQIVVAALKGQVGQRRDPSDRAAVREYTCYVATAASARSGIGSGNSFKRYKCKCCSKTFTASIRTPLSGLHKRDRWVEYARALVDGVSLRKAAKRCRINLGTSFRWRHRFLTKPKGVKAKSVKGIVEADETFFRKIGQGLEEARVGHPGSAARGKAGAFNGRLCTSPHYPRPQRRNDGSRKDPPISKPAPSALIWRPWSSTMPCSSAMAGPLTRVLRPEERDLLHISIVASRGEHVYQGFHLQNVNNYASRSSWTRRFNGVATRYLDSYLGWWRMDPHRYGDRLTMSCMLAAASGYPTT